MADSFNPTGDAANASILLDQRAHVGDRMNDDTTATVKSRDGHTMEVSFWIHPAPILSYFCVHCQKAPDSETDHSDVEDEPPVAGAEGSEDTVFEDEPHMVGAEGHFVLLSASFASSYGQVEYFMYKAGDVESGESASLDPVPLPSGHRLPTLKEFGIVPRGHGDHYLVAALCLDTGPLKYRLDIYSSEEGGWRSIPLLNPCPENDKVITSKVVTLGEGQLGWIDFQHGMLVCNLQQEIPSARYIPLPEPLPKNRDRLQALLPGPSTRRLRDLTCVNGVIKLIEMEHRVVTKKPCHSLSDSDLILSRKRKSNDREPKKLRSWDGWRAVIWSRAVSSNCWQKGPVIDVADILVDKLMHPLLLSGPRGEAVAEKLAFRDLYLAFPTLSADSNDILYLKSVAKFSDRDGQMVAVDLGKKRVIALGAYSLATHDPSVKAFYPCRLPLNLNVTSGAEVSACGKIKQIHVGGSSQFRQI
uniref:DUF1618 domain-containing protein n=1 Tax=Arundo donax TaxID=35708 RepID=A0A0A8YYU0_ARUDO